MKAFNPATAFYRLSPLLPLLVSTSLFSKENTMTPSLQNYLDGVSQLVKSQWPEVIRIWPNMDYTQNNLLIISINHKDDIPRYWLINVNGLRELAANETGTVPQPAVENYAIAKIQGRNGVIITVDSQKLPKSHEDTFRMATHELVHGWYQTEIKPALSIDSRHTPYPLDYRPRLYRYMIIRSLQQAVRQPQDAFHLCYAKFWYEKWQQEYKNEYLRIKNTDISEGSASYIENMSVVIEKDKTLVQIQHKLLPMLNTTPDEESSADGESYQLGDAAGVLLDTYQPLWKKTFYRDDIPPAEVLLNNITGCNIRSATSPFESLFRQKTEQANKQLSHDFRTIAEVLRNPSIPLLRLDVRNELGSSSNKGFYQFNGYDVTLAHTATYQGKNWKVQLKETNVFDLNSSIAVPLPAATVLKNNTLTLNHLNIKGELKVKTERARNNRLIYIPDEM